MQHPQRPWEATRSQRWAGPGGLALVAALTLGVLATVGLPEGVGPVFGVFAAANALLQSIMFPVVWMLAAVGLGRLVVWACARRTRDGGADASARVWLQIPAGVAAMLFVAHLLGVFGLLSWGGGGGGDVLARVCAWTPVVLGLALLSEQVARGPLRPEGWPVLPRGLVIAGPALGVLLLAACSPPGWLWDSEFGAYDAMSYHLQLPKEWAVAEPAGIGQLWPVDHNVYSFLPSYMEAGYLHLAAMMPVWPAMGTGEGLGEGGGVSETLIGGEGAWLIACQLLHAMMAIAASVTVGRAVCVVIGQQEARAEAKDEARGDGRARALGVIAGAMHLSVPWVIVCGSLAYNEMAVNLLFAGAILVCVQNGVGPLGRGVLVGGLVGAACSAKPTALLMCAPTAGLMLLTFAHRREWARVVVGGGVAGVVVMLPWLVRNAVASGGNPVFPFGAGAFGSGHWSAEQLAAYATAHGPDVGWVDRLGLLVSGSRGLLHAQWALGGVPIAGLIGAVVAVLLASRAAKDGAGESRVRTTAIVLIAGGASMIVAWLAFTHLQSRFFLPIAVIASMGVGLGGWTLVRVLGSGEQSAGRARAAALGLGAAAGLLGVWAAVEYTTQRRGMPNALLIAGPGGPGGSGSGLARALADAPLSEQRRIMAEAAEAEALVNLTVRPAILGTEVFPGIAVPEAGAGELGARPPAFGRVYLLGDGAPLYFFGASGGKSASVIYHTAWDRSPIGEAMRESPEDPAAWTAHLVRMDVEFVIVNFAELERQFRSGYYDRAVTIERVTGWIDEEGRAGRVVLMRTWPGGGAGADLGRPPMRALYRLMGAVADKDDGPSGAGEGGIDERR